MGKIIAENFLCLLIDNNSKDLRHALLASRDKRMCIYPHGGKSVGYLCSPSLWLADSTMRWHLLPGLRSMLSIIVFSSKDCLLLIYNPLSESSQNPLILSVPCTSGSANTGFLAKSSIYDPQLNCTLHWFKFNLSSLNYTTLWRSALSLSYLIYVLSSCQEPLDLTYHMGLKERWGATISEPISVYMSPASISKVPKLHYVFVGSQDSNRKQSPSLLCFDFVYILFGFYSLTPLLST